MNSPSILGRARRQSRVLALNLPRGPGDLPTLSSRRRRSLFLARTKVLDVCIDPPSVAPVSCKLFRLLSERYIPYNGYIAGNCHLLCLFQPICKPPLVRPTAIYFVPLQLHSGETTLYAMVSEVYTSHLRSLFWFSRTVLPQRSVSRCAARSFQAQRLSQTQLPSSRRLHLLGKSRMYSGRMSYKPAKLRASMRIRGVRRIHFLLHTVAQRHQGYNLRSSPNWDPMTLLRIRHLWQSRVVVQENDLPRKLFFRTNSASSSIVD